MGFLDLHLYKRVLILPGPSPPRYKSLLVTAVHSPNVEPSSEVSFFHLYTFVIHNRSLLRLAKLRYSHCKFFVISESWAPQEASARDKVFHGSF